MSVSVLGAQLCPTLRPDGLSPTRLLCPWNSPDEKTWVGCHSPLQGIFLTQGWSPGLPHRRQLLYCLSHQGSPNMEQRSKCVLGIKLTLTTPRPATPLFSNYSQTTNYKLRVSSVEPCSHTC